MRMIPPLVAESTRSDAERRLFNFLSRIDLPDTVCLHSVGLSEHLYKICGELDFVIIGPQGLFVIEVKGGGISMHNGIWSYTSRTGDAFTSREGPFKQARSGMFSLRARLQQMFTAGELSQIIMGYGVAFPDCDFNISSPEWSDKEILDARKLNSGNLATYLKDLAAYWHAKFPYVPNTAPGDLLKRLVQAIRPDFEQVPSLHTMVDEVEGRMCRLTEEQYDKLDLLESTQRLLVEGGAGTGKTFLAVEMARREALRGQRVLFVCFSPVLAAFLATKMTLSGVSLISVHQFMLDVVRRYGKLPDGYMPDMPLTDPWYLQQLAPAFFLAAPAFRQEQQYDVLIIDEAQDILNLDYLSVLGSAIPGGIQHGRWRIFYDRFNQGAIFGAMDPSVVELIEEFRTAGGSLSVNCRNTYEIVVQTKLATGADLGNRSIVHGPEVIFRSYRNEADAALLLENYLRELRRRRIDERTVTIVSPLSYEESSVRLINARWRRNITITSSANPITPPYPGLTFATVADFKGLENSYIAFIDINDLSKSQMALANVYVGMSRARASLWIAMHENLQPQQQDIAKRYLPRIIEGLR